MKAAVSIPDDVFQRADAVARRRRQSRSSLYAEALREFLERHETKLLTEAMRRAHATVEADPFVKAVGEHALRQIEWTE